MVDTVQPGGVRLYRIIASAPAKSGDSGGPLLLEGSRVVGVLSARTVLSTRRHAIIMGIHPDDMAALIERDRARRVCGTESVLAPRHGTP